MVAVKGNVAKFKFFRPQAHQVHLVGDFNDWRPDQLPMSRTTDGYWQAAMKLSPGVHRFRYYADGRWYTDYAAFGVEVSPYGLDSIVRIA